MADNIIFKARSADFPNDFLIWEKQLGLLIKTNKTVVGYQVQEGPVVWYTIQSVLQAILQKNFVKRARKSDRKAFYIVPSDSLIKA